MALRQFSHNVIKIYYTLKGTTLDSLIPIKEVEIKKSTIFVKD